MNSRLTERYRIYVKVLDIPKGPVYCHKGLAIAEKDRLNLKAIAAESEIRYTVKKVA